MSLSIFILHCGQPDISEYNAYGERSDFSIFSEPTAGSIEIPCGLETGKFQVL